MIHESDSALFIEHVGQVHENVGHDPPTCRKDNRTSCRKDHGSHRIDLMDHVSCILYHVSCIRPTPIHGTRDTGTVMYMYGCAGRARRELEIGPLLLTYLFAEGTYMYVSIYDVSPLDGPPPSSPPTPVLPCWLQEHIR